MEAALTSTSLTPSIDLPVNRSAPVGRRYFWRVRACNDLGCSAWSDVWYLDVGRLSDDVNGDGYGDVVAGIHTDDTTATQLGAAYVAFGRPDLGSVTMTKLAAPRAQVNGRFGSAVAMVGDVNADGYGDVVVGAWNTDNTTYTGDAYLYLGRGTWPAVVTTATTDFALAPADPDTAFGGAVAGRGDVNGDGYGDIAIASVPPMVNPGASTPSRPSYIHVEFGRSSWAFAQLGSDLVIPDPAGMPVDRFGAGLAMGDLNEDGLADLLVGAPGTASVAGWAGVYFGRSQYPSLPFTIDMADVALPSPSQGLAGFGAALHTCDSLDAPPTLAVGAPFESLPAAVEGSLRLYRGHEAWPPSLGVADATIPDPQGALNANLGLALRCEDVTGDAIADAVVGAPTSDDAGLVYVFNDVPGLQMVPVAQLAGGSPTSGRVGIAVAVTDFNGDGVGDVFAGVPFLPAGHAGRVLGWLGRPVWPASPTPDITLDNPSGVADEVFGHWID